MDSSDSVDVLIVETDADLGRLWQRHLERQGARATLVRTTETAFDRLRDGHVDMIVADLDLPGSGAMAVADYAAYRHPAAKVVFVTASSFFSDGSVFSMSPNACAFLPSRTPPEDLVAVVTHHGDRVAKH
ncbi:response regulator [Maritimibacter sp. UBA3975]|uniref:response regulator n=1 Tax=Maritimibacter sp. UBA3975 TaxID=1946833 RepID=UPI0025C424E0|nr:response regulator [Maritimibacter sp. UBA3975]